MTEEREIKNWIEERRKGSDLMCKLFNRNKELEKENAELKEQCSILADCNTCHSSCKNENAEMKEQLAKAKELIEELSSSLSVVGECGEEECELLNRAEQFIKE